MTSPVDDSFRNASTWREEAEKLRKILLDCDLTEELKWGKPCYSFEGSNIAIIQRMKGSLFLLFFKGALLPDHGGRLEKPGPNSRVGRRIRFTSVEDVRESEAIVRASVDAAIQAEKAGLKVETSNELELPDELRNRLDTDPALKMAFDALTPGRQREYVLHISSAKQSTTRAARVERNVQRILDGKGLRDP